MKTNSYTVTLGVKTPSTQVQYRMLNAEVSVSGEDPDAVLMEASKHLVCAIAKVANVLGEAPPDEIRDDLEQIIGSESAAVMYGED